MTYVYFTKKALTSFTVHSRFFPCMHSGFSSFIIFSPKHFSEKFKSEEDNHFCFTASYWLDNSRRPPNTLSIKTQIYHQFLNKKA